MKLKYPEGTTHMHYSDNYMGHWEYWKLTEYNCYYWNNFYNWWEEGYPNPWSFPKNIKELEKE